MSTYFIPDGAISFEDLRSFRKGDVRAVLEDGNLMLTDGQNYLQVFRQTQSWPIAFERCGANNPDRIIKALEATYKVRMVSEYDDDFETIKAGTSIGIGNPLAGTPSHTTGLTDRVSGDSAVEASS